MLYTIFWGTGNGEIKYSIALSHYQDEVLQAAQMMAMNSGSKFCGAFRGVGGPMTYGWEYVTI